MRGMAKDINIWRDTQSINCADDSMQLLMLVNDANHHQRIDIFKKIPMFLNLIVQ